MGALSQWGSIVKEAVTRTSMIAKFLGLIHLTSNYLFSTTIVYGPSMLPTLNLSGDVLIVERVSHRLGKVGRGDIVMVRSPLDPEKIVIKRVVAIDGDAVTFLPDSSTTTWQRSQTITVPKGHVWVQGDNTYVSTDSRYFGPVPYGLIHGKVFFRVWPLDGFGSLEQ